MQEMMLHRQIWLNVLCRDSHEISLSLWFINYFFLLAHNVSGSRLLRQQYTFLRTAHYHFKKWGFSIFDKGVMWLKYQVSLFETLKVATASYLRLRCLPDSDVLIFVSKHVCEECCPLFLSVTHWTACDFCRLHSENPISSIFMCMAL